MMNEARRKLIENVRKAASQAADEHGFLQTVVELVDGFSDGYNWTGFYMMCDDHLEVGPYIGPETEHTKIALNSGICGAAATRKATVTVDDVRRDPRFLACSITTRSEIVVPLMDGDTVLGEIDIDSDRPAFFTSEDREMLEAVAEIVVERILQFRRADRTIRQNPGR